MAIRADELSDMLRQLALLVNAELPLPETLCGLAAEMPRRELRQVLRTIADKIRSGRGFSEALADFPELRPRPLVRRRRL